MRLINKMFGKKSERVFLLKPHEIKEIIPNKGACLATDKITFDGMKVGYMYREETGEDLDNGWRFFSGTESQDYVDDISNTKVYNINTIANYDKAIIPYIDFPVGSELERIPDTNEFKKIQNSPLKKDGKRKLLLLHMLYQQIMLFSDNGLSDIASFGIMTQETSKSTGISREEISKLFKKLIEIGFIEKTQNKEFSFGIKKMMTINEIEQSLYTL